MGWVKDAAGINRKVALAEARNKEEAKQLEAELRMKSRRQRDGLEPLPTDRRLTLGALLTWWLDTYVKGGPSEGRERSRLRVHFEGSDLWPLPVATLTPGKLETFLQRKLQAGIAPASVNKLRAMVRTAWNYARKAELLHGDNPAADVAQRKVPKRAPSFLEAHEVPRVLAELRPGDRDMVAVAVYAGLRKGELFGLRKRDVDLDRGLLMVAQSYDRGTTKGRREESVPIAPGLVPYLEHALSASPGGLLFPRPDGSMRTKEDKLADRLQGALNRAGIVEGWRHVCRWWKLHPEPKRYEERHPDNARRRCAVCSHMLFPRALPRRFRLHDTRHTAATLMLSAGVDLFAVAKILRHKDPRVTFDTYSHLTRGYLRTQIDKVDLGASLAAPVQTMPAHSGTAADAGSLGGPSVHSSPGRNRDGTKRSPPERAAFVHSSLLSPEDRFAGPSSRSSLAVADGLATPVPQPTENASEPAREILPVSEGAQVAGATGFEPVAFGFGVRARGVHNPYPGQRAPPRRQVKTNRALDASYLGPSRSRSRGPCGVVCFSTEGWTNV